MNILAQILSLIAFTFFVLSVQAKEKSKLIKQQLIANILYGISYLMLGVKIAFYMNIISSIRCIIINYTKKEQPSRIYLWGLMVLIAVAGIYNYDNILSLMPIIITIIYTLSTWQDNMKLIRYSFIVAGVMWIFYNLTVGAYGSIVGNVFEIISGIISIKRFKKDTNL